MTANRKSTASFVTVPIESAGVPIYRQIYENLRRQILSGALPARSKMPSTRVLAEQLGVSRMTVVNAYKQLFAEGYIEGISGSGTYVASVLPEEMLETKNARRGSGKAAVKVSDKPVLSKRGERLAKALS